jgi:ankyrin repeat protein
MLDSGLMKLINNNNCEEIKYYFLGLKQEELDKVLNHGNFVLHKAIMNPQVSDEMIEILLDNGADPNAAINKHWKRTESMRAVLHNGSTAAHTAVLAERSLHLFDLLRGFGTDFDIKDKSGLSAKDLAKSYMMEKTINYFNNSGYIKRKTNKNNSHINAKTISYRDWFFKTDPVLLGTALTTTAIGLFYYLYIHNQYTFVR